MDDKFITGIALGMIGGALVSAYSAKTRQMVKDGAEKVKDTVCDMSKKKQKSE